MVGFVLLRDTAREDRVRMFIGFALLLAGVLGTISLFVGNPSPAASWDPGGELATAGGAFGALAAWPLSRVVSRSARRSCAQASRASVS